MVEEITGQIFGRLKIIGRVSIGNTNSSTLYAAQCECYNIKIVARYPLLKGDVKSCGCLQRDMNVQGKNREGEVYGRLTLIKKTNINQPKDGYKYLVRCSCGTEKVMNIRPVVAGKYVSCGCYRNDILTNRVVTPIPTRVKPKKVEALPKLAPVKPRKPMKIPTIRCW